ncbi:hypothetical protein AOLI_G00018320 [Acnodon oligacanthus]
MHQLVLHLQKIFSWWLLKSSNLREKRRYRVSLEEVKRRIGPSEFLSLNGLISYLWTVKSNKESLKRELAVVGIIPPPVTRLTSMCSNLPEGIHCIHV